MKKYNIECSNKKCNYKDYQDRIIKKPTEKISGQYIAFKTLNQKLLCPVCSSSMLQSNTSLFKGLANFGKWSATSPTNRK